MSTRRELLSAFDALLAPERFKDYGPNGLQVEGRDAVRRVVSGVTAPKSTIKELIASDITILARHICGGSL